MQQLGPVTAGTSVTAAVMAMLVSAWNIGECVRFQIQRDQCDATIEQAVPVFIAGVAAVSGTLGGYWTYNRRLRKPENKPL